MDNYDLLLNEIKMFLAQDEIKEENTNVEVISLYNLYNILNKDLEDLRSITQNSKLDRKIKKSKLYISLYNQYFHSKTNAYKEYSSIELLKYNKDGYHIRNFTIYKDNGSDQLRLSSAEN